MSAAPEKRWTPEEYLDFERRSEEKHEFSDGLIYAMVGASRKHVKISGNAFAGLHAQLRTRNCEVYQSDMRVKISRWRYTYPDIAAVCGEPQFEDAEVDTLINPTVIIEVLSPSTQNYDKTGKFQHYRAIESVREYILTAQDSAHIERYVRQADSSWLLHDFDGLDASLELVAIGCTLALADVYEKVTFTAD